MRCLPSSAHTSHVELIISDDHVPADLCRSNCRSGAGNAIRITCVRDFIVLPACACTDQCSEDAACYAGCDTEGFLVFFGDASTEAAKPTWTRKPCGIRACKQPEKEQPSFEQRQVRRASKAKASDARLQHFDPLRNAFHLDSKH